jgi:flavorubredoxin
MNHRVTHIKDDVYWVGVVDWNLRDFHGFSVTRGGTYNAFLVNGPEPVLVDTVKAPFTAEFLAKIAEITPLDKIRHFIVNHIEPDHSGAFLAAIRAMPNAKIYGSENAISGLHRYYKFEREIELVHTGETRELGGRAFRFFETPMAHWPDSMMTYMPKEKLLFSSDIFGQLLATSERFDHEVELPIYDAALYYANIILPFNHIVLKTLDLLPKQGITPEIILPDHGIFWQNHIEDILASYRCWASARCAHGVLILYDSMWGSTDIMADRLYHQLSGSDIKVRKMHIRSNPMSRIVTEIMFSKVVLIGTPTINDTIFPSVGQLLIYLQGLRPGPGRLWGAFGSYGWGGGGVEYLMRWYRENQHELIADPVKSRFRPSGEINKACDTLAQTVIDRLSEQEAKP